VLPVLQPARSCLPASNAFFDYTAVIAVCLPQMPLSESCKSTSPTGTFFLGSYNLHHARAATSGSSFAIGTFDSASA
jgi:hypothetical protein